MRRSTVIGLVSSVTMSAACNGSDALLGRGSDSGMGDDMNGGNPPSLNGGPPPSCQPGGDGLSNCGPNSESCCASPPVPGGTFFRSYDGVTFTDMGNPATVSDF